MKLNEQKVEEILASTEKAQVLATKYGVDQSVIQKIRRGKLWKKVFDKVRNAPVAENVA